MKIAVKVETVALQLENQGKIKEAADLRHDTTNIVKNAKPPRSNLTAQQRCSIAYLKKTPDVAVPPFDKGIGFVAEDKETLVAQAEFKNTTFNTPNKTAAYEAKIQRKLRELHKNGKMDEKVYKATPSLNRIEL